MKFTPTDLFRDMRASGPVLAVCAMSSEVGEHKIYRLLSCMCDILVGILYIYVYIYMYMYIYIVWSRFATVPFTTIHFYNPC
jgi:hypothetical protein